MLAQRLQAKPEPHEDPLLCGRLLQQEAAIFSQSPSTPPGCDVGYGEREFQRQLSASRLLLCFFWSCVSKFNSHCPCRTSQPCSIEKYFDKMAASYTAKQEFFMWLQLRLQSLHKHDFISNQLLFYCWLTQQHFNFSVSFSFKIVTSNSISWKLSYVAITGWLYMKVWPRHKHFTILLTVSRGKNKKNSSLLWSEKLNSCSLLWNFILPFGTVPLW